MEIKVLENEKNKLVFELEGAGHTFCNALKDELRNDSDVKVATYTINHPLTGKPKFFVETIKGTVSKALDSGISRLKDKNKEFLKGF
ncbi:MAG: DNA-directed RNA polymerase subunit L [Candidatus Woesearchaeota archaeon]